ncbi:HNH endonuclease [Patescibacteria group bacterium]|nr:HNH endonuclease [Patescibacteria group bacterium]
MSGEEDNSLNHGREMASGCENGDPPGWKSGKNPTPLITTGCQEKRLLGRKSEEESSARFFRNGEHTECENGEKPDGEMAASCAGNLPPGWKNAGGLADRGVLQGLSHDTPTKSTKWTTMSFKLDPETEFRLRKLRQKMEKAQKQAVGFNEVLKKMLDRADEIDGACDNKGRNSGDVRDRIDVCEKRDDRNNRGEAGLLEDEDNFSSKKPVTRYIPAKLRRKIIAGHRSKCAFPHCNMPHDVLHHPDRFALKKSHDNLVPLCKKHHDLAHAGLIQNEESGSDDWRIRAESDKRDLKVLVDEGARERGLFGG